MRKVLSILLSVLMVVSCMTCMFTTASAATGTANGSYVSFNQPGENLMAGFNAKNYIKSYSQNYNGTTAFDKVLANETAEGIDFVYDKGPAVHLASNVNYQTYFIPLAANPDTNYKTISGTSLMQVGRTYNLTFYYRTDYKEGDNAVTPYIIYNIDFNKSTTNQGRLSKTNYGACTKETMANGWIKVTAAITPAVDTVYSIYFAFDKIAASKFNISDMSLTTPDTRISADSAGTNGVATAVAGENSVTFTATPYQDSEFVGWYDGDVLVGTDSTYTYTYETVAEKVITAKFSDVNLLYGKNVKNVNQTTATDGTLGLVTTEGWWSNGWPSGGYKTSTDSHLGGDAIFNSSTGYQAHAYTFLVKPNSKYLLQLSMRSNQGVDEFKLYDNTALFKYDGKNNGGAVARGTIVKSWIGNNGQALSKSTEYNIYTATFTTNDSTEEYIPYVIYVKYTAAKNYTADYANGIYFSDLSLIEDTSASVKPTIEGAGGVVTSVKTARVGQKVTYTANPYEGNKFLGYYNGTELLTTSATYTAQFTGTPITAKFTGVNLATNVDASGFYTFSANDATNPHKPVASAVDGPVNLGGNSTTLTVTDGYGEVYFIIDGLKANTKYQISYYARAEAGAVLKGDSALSAWVKAEVDGYWAQREQIKADYAAGTATKNYNTALWEIRPGSYGNYGVTYWSGQGSFTGTNEFKKFTKTITVPKDGAYIMDIKFAGASGNVTFADICVSPVYEATATAVGNGAAKVTNDYGEYTFTATPYQNSQFVGWYNGEEFLSENTTYVAPSLTSNLNLVAKFTDENLLAGKVGSENWTTITYTGKADDVTATDSRYGGTAIKKYNSGISWQWSALKMTLKPNTKYSLQFSLKGTNDLYSLSLKGGTVTFSGTKPNGTISSTYTKELATAADQALSFENWQTITKEFTTPNDITEEVYYLYFHYGKTQSHFTGDVNTDTNAIVSDFSLVEKATYTTSVAHTGNGTAFVSATRVDKGQSVTYTAVSYQDSTFNGWYMNDVLVSTDKVYTIDSITANTALVAKFSDVNLLEGYNASNFSHTDYWGKKVDTTIDMDGLTYPAVQLESVGFNADRSVAYGQTYFFGVDLTAGTTYNFQMGMKSYCRPNSIGIASEAHLRYDSQERINGAKEWTVHHGSNGTDIKEGALVPSDTILSKTHKFTVPTSGKYYIFINYLGINSVSEEEKTNGETAKAYLYKLSLIGKSAITTNEEGNGGAKAEPALVTNGDSTTLTATEYANGGKFLGWFKDGALVSTDKVMEVNNVVEPLTYTAKFTKTNVAADWNFVNTSNFAKKGGVSTEIGTGWKKSPTSWVDGVTADVEDSLYGGNSTIKLTGTVQSQALYLPIQVKANTKYTMSFSLGYEYVKLSTIKLYKSNLNIHDGEDGEKGDVGGMVKAGTELIGASGWSTTAVDGTVFKNYTASFTTDDTIVYLLVHFAGLTSDNADGKKDYAILSDFSVVEADSADLDFAPFIGNSIRAAGNQALRFKYDIASDIITNGFEGLTVKEVGAVAIRNSYLNGAELVVGGTYTVGTKTYSAVSGKFSDALLEAGEPTVALYNIGAKKDPSGNVLYTDYNDYGDKYSVRAYMVVDLNGTEVTLYGEVRTASVFAVMQEIEAEGSAADKEAVANVLASATGNSTMPTVNDYYTAWKAQ